MACAVLVAVVVGLVPEASSAAPGAVVLTSSNFYFPGDNRPLRGVAPIPVILIRGGDLYVYNQDSDAHTLTEYAEVERFDTKVLPRELVPIAGIEALPPATYTFHCTFHDEMVGTLIIV